MYSSVEFQLDSRDRAEIHIHRMQWHFVWHWVGVVIFIALQGAIGAGRSYGREPKEDLGYIADLAERALSQGLPSKERLDAIREVLRRKDASLSARPLRIADIVVAGCASHLASGLIFEQVAKGDANSLNNITELIEAHTRSGQLDVGALRELLVHDMDYTPQKATSSPYRLLLDMVREKRPDIAEKADSEGRPIHDLVVYELMMRSPSGSWDEAFNLETMDPLKLVTDLFGVRMVELGIRFAMPFKDMSKTVGSDNSRLLAYKKFLKEVSENISGDDCLVFGGGSIGTEMLMSDRVADMTRKGILGEGKDFLNVARNRSLLYSNPNKARSILLGDDTSTAQQAPISLHPENPHYFLWRGRPTVLITSGEHYGAVLNRAFDYRKYLDTLQSHGFNLTRTFSGAYCEPPGAFNIERNTLAPAKSDLLCPWARSSTPGYANGGNKFDLKAWDPAYFQRLGDFVVEAGKRGIVVEMVLFCPFYEDSMWALSPMNVRNNVNGIGDVPRTEVYTLLHKDILAVQVEMVQRIVAALKDCDNVYYEICNEPYFGGVTEEWQAHVAGTIASAEAGLGHRHLIAQNIANNTKRVDKPDPHVSIFNFHYAKPPVTVAENYHLNKVIGDDETGFAGEDRVRPYRLEGWDFILAGGAVFSNLDYSFAVGHEQGDARINAPGGGGPELRRQLQILKGFIEGLDFIRMGPEESVIKGELPTGVTVRVLCDQGRAYALYVNGNGLTTMSLDMPSGSYGIEWVNTKNGRIEKAESVRHNGGTLTLQAPEYHDDIALRIKKPIE